MQEMVLLRQPICKGRAEYWGFLDMSGGDSTGGLRTHWCVSPQCHTVVSPTSHQCPTPWDIPH